MERSQESLREKVLDRFVRVDTQIARARKRIVNRVLYLQTENYRNVRESQHGGVPLVQERSIEFDIPDEELVDAPVPIAEILNDLNIVGRALQVAVTVREDSYHWRSGGEYTVQIRPQEQNTGDLGIEIYSYSEPFCRIEKYMDWGDKPEWIWQGGELEKVYNNLCHGLSWKEEFNTTHELHGSYGGSKGEPDPLLGRVHTALSQWVTRSLNQRKK